MERKIKQEVNTWIDWIRSLKDRVLKVERITEKTENNIINIIQSQDNLISHIVNIFKTKCWLEEDEKFKKLKNEVLSKLKEIKTLNNKQKQCITLSKQEINKSISLLKSFYDKTTKDKLTWLWNEEFVNNLLDILWLEQKQFILIYFDLNNFKKVNDNYGHQVWDKLIKEFARILKLLFWEWDKTYIARIHWDEFNIISLEDEEIIKKKLQKLWKWLENSSIEIIKEWKKKKIWIHTAYWYAKSDKVNSIWELIHRADKRMYENKIKSKQDKIDI